jgi:hypothetical protein
MVDDRFLPLVVNNHGGCQMVGGASSGEMRRSRSEKTREVFGISSPIRYSF